MSISTASNIKVALLALVATLLAGYVAISISDEFYAVAPFHYDSASYLYGSLITKRVYDVNGLLAALKYASAQKDTLDLTLRLLIAPNTLSDLHGHMYVLLPFLFAFLWAIGCYVFKKTDSFGLTALSVAAVFMLQSTYAPFVGMADYWKDNLAVWLLGAAIMAWLLSDRLRNHKYAFFCGLLLGLLVMQRTALAVYAAAMFAPVFLLNLLDGWRKGETTERVISSAVLCAPAVLITSFVAFLQWDSLYRYYFVAGYSYGSLLEVANMILEMVENNRSELLPIVVVVILSIPLAAVLSRRSSVTNWRDVMLALWFVIALPTVVVASHAAYPEILTVWTVLLIALLATLIPAMKVSRPIAAGFATLCIAAMITQHALCIERARAQKAQFATIRHFYDEMLDALLKQPAPRRLAILYDEDSALIKLHMWYHHGIPMDDAGIGYTDVGYSSVHDSYYLNRYGSLTPEQYFERVKGDLESHDGAYAIASCDQGDVASSGAYGPDGMHVAIPVAVMFAKYLKTDSHWHAIAKFSSHRGCVSLYKLAVDSRATLEPSERRADIRS